MKLKHLIILVALLQVKLSLGQTIPEKFFGNNAWYTVYTPYDPAVNMNLPTPAANDAFLQYIQDVANSGAKFK